MKIDLPNYAVTEVRVHARCMELMKLHPGRFTSRLNKRLVQAEMAITAAVKIQVEEQTQ